jgi:GR25 family glycosyltransferase involved in LPS biosynthesis
MRLDSVLYVNLPESIYRRDCVESEIHKVGLFDIAHHHEGIRPEASLPLPRGFSPELLGSLYGDQQARGALGCALAHYNAYKRIQYNGWQNTLILEDDAVIDVAHFKTLLDNAPADADIIYLNRSQWPVAVIDDTQNSDFFERVKGQLCTVGYIVRQSAIERLIERCDPFAPRPNPVHISVIDVVLANEMTDLKIFRPLHGAVDQDLTKFGSIIAGVPAVEYQKKKELGSV